MGDNLNYTLQKGRPVIRIIRRKNVTRVLNISYHELSNVALVTASNLKLLRHRLNNYMPEPFKSGKYKPLYKVFIIGNKFVQADQKLMLSS